MKIIWQEYWNWLWLPPEKNFLVIADQLFKATHFCRFHPTNVTFYFVQAGEDLKMLEHWPSHVHQIFKTMGEQSIDQIIGLGGGSVGDFAGFFASVYRRGTSFCQIPTTWLAAIDSAHGGKTGINVGNFKNQIGTFHQAELIFLCKEILRTQGQEHLMEGLSELAKIGLIRGGSLWKRLNTMARKLDKVSKSDAGFRELSSKFIDTVWPILKPAVRVKYEIVRKDPYETTGYRQILNLGHTMGHVFELNLNLRHGLAVKEGLRFALFFSVKKNYLAPEKLEEILQSDIMKVLYPAQEIKKDNPRARLTSKQLRQSLLRDKKRKSNGPQNLNFIFIQDIGKVKRSETTIQELTAEYFRQERYLR